MKRDPQEDAATWANRARTHIEEMQAAGIQVSEDEEVSEGDEGEGGELMEAILSAEARRQPDAASIAEQLESASSTRQWGSDVGHVENDTWEVEKLLDRKCIRLQQSHPAPTWRYLVQWKVRSSFRQDVHV